MCKIIQIQKNKYKPRVITLTEKNIFQNIIIALDFVPFETWIIPKMFIGKKNQKGCFT